MADSKVEGRTWRSRISCAWSVVLRRGFTAPSTVGASGRRAAARNDSAEVEKVLSDRVLRRVMVQTDYHDRCFCAGKQLTRR
jgi:hypothetical protein